MPRTLFSVPFRSSLGDEQLQHLHRRLDMVTYLSPKPGVFGAQPGFARLDAWSGLYLVKGEADGQWRLEARTWGNPPEQAVRQWHHQAACVAHELDPSVPLPGPDHGQPAG
jgi:hypothetical protein